MKDSFKTRTTLQVDGRTYRVASLAALASQGHDLSRLPWSHRILLENLLRHEDGETVTRADIEALLNWDPQAEPSVEIAFRAGGQPFPRSWTLRIVYLGEQPGDPPVRVLTDTCSVVAASTQHRSLALLGRMSIPSGYTVRHAATDQMGVAGTDTVSALVDWLSSIREDGPDSLTAAISNGAWYYDVAKPAAPDHTSFIPLDALQQEYAGKCGPISLAALLVALGRSTDTTRVIESALAQGDGITIGQLKAIAAEYGVDLAIGRIRGGLLPASEKPFIAWNGSEDESTGHFSLLCPDVRPSGVRWLTYDFPRPVSQLRVGQGIDGWKGIGLFLQDDVDSGLVDADTSPAMAAKYLIAAFGVLSLISAIVILALVSRSKRLSVHYPPLLGGLVLLLMACACNMACRRTEPACGKQSPDADMTFVSREIIHDPVRVPKRVVGAAVLANRTPDWATVENVAGSCTLSTVIIGDRRMAPGSRLVIEYTLECTGHGESIGRILATGRFMNSGKRWEATAAIKVPLLTTITATPPRFIIDPGTRERILTLTFFPQAGICIGREAIASDLTGSTVRIMGIERRDELTYLGQPIVLFDVRLRFDGSSRDRASIVFWYKTDPRVRIAIPLRYPES